MKNNSNDYLMNVHSASLSSCSIHHCKAVFIKKYQWWTSPWSAISNWAWETQGIFFHFFLTSNFYEVIQFLWNFLVWVPRRLFVNIFSVRIWLLCMGNLKLQMYYLYCFLIPLFKIPATYCFKKVRIIWKKKAAKYYRHWNAY